MNNIYRLVWNAASRVWVVASELASAKGKGKNSPQRLTIKVGGALTLLLAGLTAIESARAWMVDPSYVLNDGSATQVPNDGGSIYNVALGTETVATTTGPASGNKGIIAIGFGAKATYTDAIAVGMNSFSQSYGAVAFGPASKVIGTTSGNSIAFGNHAAVQENSYGALALGAGASVAGKNASAIGANASTDGEAATAIGHYSKAVGTNSLSIGYKSAVSGADAVAIGGFSSATADSAMAIGNNAKASLSGALALGSESNADTEAGINGYTPANANTASKNAVSATISTRAAVSLGDNNAGIRRQITDVAAGTADTDAVNVAQLKALEDTPLNFTGNSGVTAKKLGETIAIKGGKVTAGTYSDTNLNTVVDEAGNLNIQMADNPVFNSAIIGLNTKLDGSGLTIVNGPSVTSAGIDAANKKIINVAEGEVSETSKEAVNGSQLKATNDKVEVNTTNITNLGDKVSNNTTNIANLGDV
ncbi:TPA: ESPR-type extended signal peptide-containing protein, partial [Enterobacter cloacae]